MHPRSKHWHLIDYIITRKSDLKDFAKSRVYRGAECWTDHRLLCSTVHFQFRPPVKRQSRKKQIDRSSFHNQPKLNELREALAEALDQLPEPDPAQNYNPEQINSMWNDFSNQLFETTTEIFGVSKRKHQDWFDENNLEIRDLLQRKNQAHTAAVQNPSSQIHRAAFARLRSEAQAG